MGFGDCPGEFSKRDDTQAPGAGGLALEPALAKRCPPSLSGQPLFSSWGRRNPKTSSFCPPPTRAPQNKRVFLATFAAVLGNFSFGYALVYTSPVIPALELSLDPDLRLTKTQASWFGVRAML